ncbi:hypothetical protein EGI94_19995 [Stutzerimonas stutzeri]|uniref:sulfotransferase family protein n=1 Tax=Stutzerimonas stutzeri TaxID=316 RepID=UPI000F78E747|nr:sulfotransferase family protein [Stutzerimonas stutzeri]RRV30161.1 hypothetical protein EGI94_19995 [Stutzerimonas stutzeri]
MTCNRPKVFGIGFHKTGTKSLASALETLGYRVHGPEWVRDAQACVSLQSLWVYASRVVDSYDAFQDNPWPLLWRELVARFPDARFILTVRDEAQWLDSAVRYFGSDATPMRRLIYGADAGSPIGNEDTYLARYHQHNAEVRQALAGSKRFLEFDIASGEGWKPLCQFLEQPIPSLPFPHANRG